MQTGQTCSLVSGVCFWLVISAAVAHSGDNMEANTASQKAIRQSQCLCAGEQSYVNKRKQLAKEALNNLGISVDADSVPNIALLASGGGQRAAVGLVGTLHQMKTEGILDAVLYLGGVSGSTWSMASIYSDPDWSNNLDLTVSRLSTHEVTLEKALEWLGERAREDHFSLTDVWGVLTSAGIMKQMDLRHLSDEATRNTTNPYPIYSAIEKKCFTGGPIEGKWFEVSPHEAGFTELGAFIETSQLGSKFQRGELLERYPEMDMVKLQGVLGCALAHGDSIRGFIPPWMNVPGHIDNVAQQYLRVYNALDELVALVKSTIQDQETLQNLQMLHQILLDHVNVNKTSLLESITPEERNNFFKLLIQELTREMEAWCETLEDGPFKTHVTMLTKQVIPLLAKWEWGTTCNFLYQYEDPAVPTCLTTNERFHLIDAGILINVGYPPFLGDKRDIDVIIAPEYSSGDMFETLTFGRDYAAEVKKPFPRVDDKILEEKNWPKSCYVFEGTGKEPTIIYMPLFNRDNCKDQMEFEMKMYEFSTFQRPFNKEKSDFVLEITKANLRNNKETLLTEFRKAAVRRRSRRTSNVQQVADPCPFATA